jgi:antigen 43
MATFTWNSTTGSTWEDTSAIGWNGPASFVPPGDSFFITGSATFTINNVGSTDGNDNATYVGVFDSNVTLLMDSTNAPNFDISTELENDGTINLGTQGLLTIGDNTGGGGPGGIIYNFGVITDAGSGAQVFIGNSGSNDSTIFGSGTFLATAGGLMDFTPGITVASGQSLVFQIGAGANLEFDDAVNSGAVQFLASSGLLVLTDDNHDQITNDGTFLNDLTYAATISGLTVGTSPTDETNAINIAAIPGGTIESASLDTGSDLLTVFDQNGDTYSFQLAGSYTGDQAAVAADTSGAGGFDVFLYVCYVGGTAILTDRGEARVESLKTGDHVITLVDGAQVAQTVKWVGRRDIDLSRHSSVDSVAPVRIVQGALGDNLPHRDLVLSPDHCLFIDGGLFPAKLLVNDMTIVRDLSANSVSYYHVELERHSVMIAEGVPAESYLDTGNRAFFSNAGLATILHPELNINENLRCWETDACAPLIVKPEAVKPVWQRFADRAVALGRTVPAHVTTRDAGIHLMVDGNVVRPLAAKGKTVSFMLPGNARSVRLMSRATRQSALTPWLDDPRTLGVAIRSVTLRDRTGETVLGADHPALRDGWHAPEHGADGAVWRWSAGNASLPIQAEGPCMVEITVSETATYIENSRLAA